MTTTPCPPDPEPPEGGDPGGGDDESDPPGYPQNLRQRRTPPKLWPSASNTYGPDGYLITESYRDFTRNQIHNEFESLDEFLRHLEAPPRRKQVIIELLEEHGIVLDNLAEEIGKEYGDFDLICHIAWDQPPLTRKERANNVKKAKLFHQATANRPAAVLDRPARQIRR